MTALYITAAYALSLIAFARMVSTAPMGEQDERGFREVR